MNTVDFGERACHRVLPRLDSYMDDELPAEASREILDHLESCPACAHELETRIGIKERLRAAARSEAAAPGLEARIRRSIRERESRPRSGSYWARPLLAAAAMLVVCAGAWIAYWRTTGSRDAYIRSLSGKVAGILRAGLGDHVHCAVFRKFPNQRPPVEELVQTMGPEYGGLVSLVKARVPDQYRIVMAHQCSYHGRSFVHLALKDGSKLLSLVITRRGQGESFEKDKLVPVLSHSGISIYRAGVERFEIASFETRDHLAYLVSDLGEKQNLELMAALAPAVRDFLGKLKAT